MITTAYNRAYQNFKSQLTPQPTNCSSSVIPLVKIIVQNPDHITVNPARDKSSHESYTITINQGDLFVITASTTIAALRSAWTLFQIPDLKGTLKYPITIRDKPEMTYRGVMIDTTRSLNPTLGERHSITRLYEVVDKMEVLKLNVLHWHLTDTDGISFNFEKAQPRNPYLSKEIQNLVQYSRDRGVSLIPELDVPGHTGTVWGEQTGISDFAPEDCPLQFNFDSPSAKSFIFSLFQYIVTDLFRDSLIFGTGQDEVAPCGNNYAKDATSLQKGFYNIAKLNGNRTVFVWADTILEQGLSFDKDTLVAPWRIYAGHKNYADGVNSLLRQGYRTLIYNQNPWYIGRSTTAEGLYSYHPLDGVRTDKIRGVIGGAVSLWEPSIQDLKDQILWPMSASVAEILWSKREFTKTSGFNRERYNAVTKFIENVPKSSSDKAEICS